MKILALGGAGKITREAVLDLVQFGNYEQITIADYNENEAKKVAEWLNSDNVDYCFIDIRNKEEAINTMKEYDMVLDGTTISLNDISTECIAKAGCSGINLNGFGEEYKYDQLFKENNQLFVPGFGMTPGTTNMMALDACADLDEIKNIRVSHGAFRPIAFSKSIAETTTYEYDPQLPGRVVYENGELIQVKPFARPRKIELAEPYPALTQYIIPHSEAVTLSQYFDEIGRNVDLIEVRGSWPLENMELIKTLYNYGILKNDKIKIDNTEFGVMDCIAEYLVNSEKGQNTELYGYALHVEVEGLKDGNTRTITLKSTHPASDGSVEGWEKLRAYTRSVGIPFAIGLHLMAQGKVKETKGALIPEKVFNPEDIFNELTKREILIHKYTS